MNDHQGSRTPEPPRPVHRICEDLHVTGILRVADNLHIHGDLIARAGLILGDNVVIDGDVYTDGEVEMGTGSTIEGDLHGADQAPGDVRAPIRVRPRSSALGHRPVELPAPGHQIEELSQADPARVYETVRTTMTLLWDLLCTTSPSQLEADGRPTDLAPEALDDLLAGLGHLLERTYGTQTSRAAHNAPHDGAHTGAGAEAGGGTSPEEATGPWSAEAVIDVLYQRVLPLILPIKVTRLDPTHAELEIGRPEPFAHDEDPRGWGLRALLLIDLLTGTLRPGATVQVGEEPEVFNPRADPEHVRATVRLG